MSNDYTPSTDEVRDQYASAPFNGIPTHARAEFDRWLAARDADHEKAVRERIARDIEAEAVAVDEHGNRGLWIEDAVRITREG